MATSTMAVTCSASGFSALSSSSSSFQAGCSSSTQELTCYSHRACQSSLGSGIYTNRECGVQVRAGKGPPKQGRGYNSKKAAADGIRKIMRGRDADNAFDGWTQVLMQEELPEGKNKAIIHNNAGYVLVKKEDALYAIQANCTSCKFPIIEGKTATAEGAEDGTPGDAQIECPLCHTKFSLEDGKVVEFCPKDGPIAWAIGTLKSKETPVDAKVYSARISKSGRVYVRFATASPALP
ncbi:hypothetical protein M758_8G158300 [Ceratodon purpureus]|uniref:Rieske-like [2Fe-2S] domain-containing protein n=1 Tax=Ceratodon purpureus TaxID=3225 RepID=A0A8T0H7M5_CERPU|nr:hypothetical protein KC19_8G162400 [Ceratodon purpureus]KAG0609109.1 hypothetical protein M758_8G158300 [Ceratodon purpureus]